jgi:very-short-patch-repair endonuclease
LRKYERSQYKNNHGGYKTKYLTFDTVYEYLKNNTCPVCNKKLYDASTLRAHIDEDRCADKDGMIEFKKNWSEKCHCGCGQRTIVGRVAINGHTRLDPWNKGLTKHDDKRLMVNSIRRIDEMCNGINPNYTFGTSIELKIKELLDYNKTPYKYQYNFFYKYTCDFAIPQLKLIIECDGDYWHSYPNGTDKDKAQDKFIMAKGWHIVRFWERDIKNDIDKCIKTLNDKIMELQL